MTFVLNILDIVAYEVRTTGNRDDFALYICRDPLCNNKCTKKNIFTGIPNTHLQFVTFLMYNSCLWSCLRHP